MPRTPPSFFVNAVSLAEVSAFGNAGRDARLRKTGHCVEKQLKKVGFIQQYLQKFVSTPTPGLEMNREVMS